MFTTKTERKTAEVKTQTGAIGPGQYKTNKSTLKRSQYRGMAPFMQMAKKQSIFDQIQKENKYKPDIGQYEDIKPQYIRGANPLTSHFASKDTRFKEVRKDDPGPCEYFTEQERVEVKNVIPKQIRKPVLDQEKVPSIPYLLQKKPDCDILKDPRQKWVLQNGQDAVMNPNPTDYNPFQKPELPRQLEVQVPIGAGGCSLARYQYESAWSKAPERQSLKTELIGPARYDIQEQQKKTVGKGVLHSKTQRFMVKEDVQLGPGTYAFGAVDSIETNALKQKQHAELRREMQKRLQEADELIQQIRPVEKKQKQQLPSYIGDQQRQQMENPDFGEYQQTKDKKNELSINAQMKLALLSTFTTEKWHQTGSSIPHKVLTDENEVVEEKIFEKPPQKGVLERQTQREISLDKPKNDIAPGQYDISPKTFQTQQKSGPMNSQSTRNDLYKEVIQKQKMEEYAAQQEKILQEENKERRQKGGLETQVNFTLAKVGEKVQAPFNQSQIRDTSNLPQHLVDAPPVGNYNIQHKIETRLPVTLNKMGRDEELPQVLKEGIGPGAERALNLLADRKNEERMVGPGYYVDPVNKMIKKSFNVSCK